MKQGKIIVVGLGNKVLGDDGIGAYLITDLQRELNLDSLSFQISVNGGMEIIDLLNNYQKAFILDGIRTAEGNPGDIYIMDSDDYMETLHISNVHDVDFKTALKLAEKINLRMPEKITIIAVEVMEDKVFNEFLTPSLMEKYSGILQLTINSIKSGLYGAVG